MYDLFVDDVEIKASIAAVTFILTSSARYGVPDSVLANELQQTGLPKEHTQALCRVYSGKVSALTAQLHKQSLRTSYPCLLYTSRCV